MKVLLRTYKIDIQDIEDTLSTWKAKSCLKNVISDEHEFERERRE
jgi:hypothetical protein